MSNRWKSHKGHSFILKDGDAALIIRDDMSSEFHAPGIRKGQKVSSGRPAGVLFAFNIVYHNEGVLKKVLEYPDNILGHMNDREKARFNHAEDEQE